MSGLERVLAAGLAALLLSAAAWAQGEPNPTRTAPSLDETLRVATQAYGGEPAQGLSNPGNQVLALPSRQLTTELRSDTTVDYGPFQLDVRPRLHAEQEARPDSGRTVYLRPRPDLTWNHATIAARLGPLAVSYGLETYQWGPGELVSPSNQLVPTEVLQQVGYYEVPGEHLLRLNAGLGDSLSLVLLYRPAFVLLRQAAKPRALLLKPEYRAASGRWYVGLSGETAAQGEPNFGGYGQLELHDGWFIYADAVRLSKNTTLYPSSTPQGWNLAPRSSAKAAVNALTGLRYNGPSGTDLRLEYLHQDSGYGASDWQADRAALTEVSLDGRPALAAASFSAGPLLQSRDYLYTSLRLPDWGPQRSWSFWLRSLQSLSDASAYLTAGGQWNATDHIQGLLEVHSAVGAADRDLTRFYQSLFNLGLMLSW